MYLLKISLRIKYGFPAADFLHRPSPVVIECSQGAESKQTEKMQVCDVMESDTAHSPEGKQTGAMDLNELKCCS